MFVNILAMDDKLLPLLSLLSRYWGHHDEAARKMGRTTAGGFAA